MLELETKNDVEPVCPHCEQELRTVWMRELNPLFSQCFDRHSNNSIINRALRQF